MDPTENTVYYAFTGLLPNIGCPIVMTACCRNVFTELLPSKGYTHHNSFGDIYVIGKVYTV
jgi:hypothetical protein